MRTGKSTPEGRSEKVKPNVWQPQSFPGPHTRGEIVKQFLEAGCLLPEME